MACIGAARQPGFLGPPTWVTALLVAWLVPRGHRMEDGAERA